MSNRQNRVAVFPGNFRNLAFTCFSGSGMLPLDSGLLSRFFPGNREYGSHGRIHLIGSVDGDIRSHSDYDIRLLRKLSTMQTKCFAHQSLNAISPYSIPHLSLYTNPQATLRQVICRVYDSKTFTIQSSTNLVHPFELPVIFHYTLLRESKLFHKNYTASCLRPRARRLLITARPAWVFMRTRNPWVR